MKFFYLIAKSLCKRILAFIITSFPILSYLLGSISSTLLTILATISSGIYARTKRYIFFRFFYNCFVNTIQTDDDSGVNQAEEYDETGRCLALGRTTMLGLCIADLYQKIQENNNNSEAKNGWRLPYDPSLKCHTQFKSYIYAFTWEDPADDLKVLELTPQDEILLITSAGDNVLNYLCDSGINRIHSVDINPNQNHLLELKMAAIKGLAYEDFWLLFGIGCHPHFPEILDSKLSPYLSTDAYQFWKKNQSSFNSSFYETGGSGNLIRMSNLLKRIFGKTGDITDFCHAETIEEQRQIYWTKIRPFFIRKWLLTALDNPLLLWLNNGVPRNQRKMLKEGKTMYDYVYNSLDPVASNYLFRMDNVYFYYLCLMGCYSQECCPKYLTRKGFHRLQSEGKMDGVKIHTNSILNVLKSMEDENLSKAILMDHIDWFSMEEALDEIKELSRVIKKDGLVVWRSIAEEPWYNEIFTEQGFLVEPISVRDSSSNVALDRVNTYASFYRATKL